MPSRFQIDGNGATAVPGDPGDPGALAALATDGADGFFSLVAEVSYQGVFSVPQAYALLLAAEDDYAQGNIVPAKHTLDFLQRLCGNTPTARA